MQDADYSKGLRRTKIKKNATDPGKTAAPRLALRPVRRASRSTAVGELRTHPRKMPSGVRALGGRLLLARRGVLGCIERDPGERPTFLGDGRNPFAIFIPRVLKRWLQGSLLDAEAQSATTE